MNLRKIFWEKGALYDLEIDPSACVAIAEYFTEGFTKWKDEKCYRVFNSEKLFYIRDSAIYEGTYSIKELISIYQKEEELL